MLMSKTECAEEYHLRNKRPGFNSDRKDDDISNESFFLTNDVVSIRPPLNGLAGHGRGSFVSLEADFPAKSQHLASVLASTGNVGVGFGVDTVVLLLPMPFRPGFEVLVPFPGLELFR